MTTTARPRSGLARDTGSRQVGLGRSKHSPLSPRSFTCCSSDRRPGPRRITRANLLESRTATDQSSCCTRSTSMSVVVRAVSIDIERRQRVSLFTGLEGAQGVVGLTHLRVIEGPRASPQTCRPGRQQDDPSSLSHRSWRSWTIRRCGQLNFRPNRRPGKATVSSTICSVRSMGGCTGRVSQSRSRRRDRRWS